MVVQTHNLRPGPFGVVGLHIGMANAHLYFPRELEFVELELDHLHIACQLEASFWIDRPEIHDSRLSSWLKSKRNTGKLAMETAPVTLISSGSGSFRLQLMPVEPRLVEQKTKVHPLPPRRPVQSVTAAVFESDAMLPQALAVVKVGRLKGDERTSLAANH